MVSRLVTFQAASEYGIVPQSKAFRERIKFLQEKEEVVVEASSRLIDIRKSVMKQILFMALLICLFTMSSAAQTRRQDPCPKITFINPVYEIEAGKPLILTIKLPADFSVTYNWTISAGAIESGQGTDKIEIDTKEAEGGTITATVELGGLAPVCDRTRSHTVMVIAKPRASKVYEGKFVNNGDLERQVDELINAILMTGDGKGCIIFYAGRKAPAVEVKRLTEVAIAQLKKRKADQTLFVIVDGGKRDETYIELWAVPKGAEPPKPSPNK
jgi:hypothetical protein